MDGELSNHVFIFPPYSCFFFSVGYFVTMVA